MNFLTQHTYTTSSLSFFLIRPAKRVRYANEHVRYWRRQTGEARKKKVSSFFFSGCRRRFSRLARRSRSRALPSLNVKKTRECSSKYAWIVQPAVLESTDVRILKESTIAFQTLEKLV